MSDNWQGMKTAPHGVWILVSTIHDCCWQACWTKKDDAAGGGFFQTEGGMRLHRWQVNGWQPMLEASKQPSEHQL